MKNTMDPKTAQDDQQQTGGDDASTQSSKASTATPVSYSGGNKEVLGGVGLGNFEIPDLTEIGKDVELPKEVESAGVKVIPSPQRNVPLQKSTTVQYTGPVQTGSATNAVKAVPLTDDQIAAGLKMSVKSSWRWLSEWCVRKLKQMKRMVKT